MDKRTKEYKEWKKNFDNQSKGLGDDIDKITKATGIKKVVELFTPEGKDCGCDKRKETLNKLFPKNKVNCFTEEQYNQWTNFVNRENKNTVTKDEQKLIVNLLLEIFNMSVAPCSTCSGRLWLKYINKINTVYEQYQEK